MIIIQVGSIERNVSEISEGWLSQQVNQRHKDGQATCVRVTIRNSDVDMVLSTGACARGGGGGRAPSPTELRILELWNKLGLNAVDFPPGHLISFLKRVEG